MVPSKQRRTRILAEIAKCELVRELSRSTILPTAAGRGSAWLERRVWDAEDAGSNPAAPI